MKDNYIRNKCIEFFDIIERDNHMIEYNDDRTFSNGVKLSNFWKKNRVKCYQNICEMKDIYPKTYIILTNVYKYGLKYLSVDEKCVEYCQEVEKKKKMIDGNTTLKFSDGSKYSIFIRDYKQKIIEYVNEHKKDYPIAYRYINLYYDLNDSMRKRCIEFFDVLEKEEAMLKSTDQRLFSDGGKMGYFWFKNYHQIYDMVNKDIYKELYPNANRIINYCYDKKDKKPKKEIKTISYDDKVLKVVEFINDHNRLITSDDDIKFEDSSRYYNFYYQKHRGIIDFFKNDKNVKLYPIAANLIMTTKKGYKRKLLSVEDKANEFIEIVRLNKETAFSDTQLRFSDKTNVFNFWNIYFDKVYNYVKDLESQGYEDIIFSMIKEKCERRLMSFDNKIMEYIELVEQNQSLLSTNKSLKFKDQTSVVSFCNNYKKEIVLKFCDEKMRKKYPIASNLIQRGYYKDAFFKIKLGEYLRLVEENGSLLCRSTLKFSDGTQVRCFVGYFKERIDEAIQTKYYMDTYPVGCELVKNKRKKKTKNL